MSCYLGIDVGTTRTKLIFWDSETDELLARFSAPTPELPGDIRMHDHDALWNVLVGLAQKTPAALRRLVSSVAIASIAEEVVLLSSSGASLGPTPCWYAVSRLTPASIPDAELSSRTIFSYYRATDPAQLKSAATFTDVSGYLALRLTGLTARSATMDLSHASRTGLLTGEGAWDAARMDSSGASLIGRPPRLVESGTKLASISPEAADAWGLPRSALICAGGHDHLCGALAAGAAVVGDVFVSVGTSESVLQLVSRSQLSRIADSSVECGIFVAPALGYVHRSQPSGLRIAQLLHRQGKTDITAYYRELAETPEKISPSTSEFLAELESQATASARLIDQLSAASGFAPNRVIIGGVPASFDVWRRLRAAAVPRNVAFLSEGELSGKGAAMLAARGGEES